MVRNTESLGMKPTAYTVKTLNIFGGQFGLAMSTTRQLALLLVVLGSSLLRRVSLALVLP